MDGWPAPNHKISDCGRLRPLIQPQDAVEKAVITSEMIAAGGDDLDEVRQADGRGWCHAVGFSPLTEANHRSSLW